MIKYQVFLSSVSTELHEDRAAIIKHLLESNRYFPIAMEFFPAYDSTITLLYRYLQDSDVYVLILKDSLGSPIGKKGAAFLHKLAVENESIPPALNAFCKNVSCTPEELTFTQVEYIFAQALKMKILAFVYTAPGEALSDRITNFCGTSFDHTAKAWKTRDELTRGVLDSLNFLVSDKKNRDLGWVRRMEDPMISRTRRAGILELTLDGNGFADELRDRLPLVQELDLFYTTGRGFITKFQKLIGSLLAQGSNLKLLCAFPRYDFLSDVAAVEKYKYGNRDDIHDEFLEVIKTLGHIYANAKLQSKEQGLTVPTGTIEVANSRTLFRSSLLVAHQSDDVKWGWLTLTLPPEKSLDMISLQIEQKPEDDPNENLMRASADHFDIVWKTAVLMGEVIQITDQTDFLAEYNRCYKKEEKAFKNREVWEEKQMKAMKAARRRRGKKILIEVAAQHPLKDGLYPDKEFAARLDFGIKLWKEKAAAGYEVEFYVPGSVHLDFEGIPDDISLAEAGVTYLLEHGVPEEIVHGDDLNTRYDDRRYWRGVYNSADECYIAAQYFLEEEKHFSELYCICSPNQAMRKTLHFIHYGILPMVYTVPVPSMFHKVVGEIYDSIPYLLFEDPDCQSPDSKEALRTRKERFPGFRE